MAALKISDLKLSIRTRTILANAGITTVGQLLRVGPSGILAIKRAGYTTQNDIRFALESHGVEEWSDPPDTPRVRRVRDQQTTARLTCPKCRTRIRAMFRLETTVAKKPLRLPKAPITLTEKGGA
jgi:hypothetical protein